MKSKENSHTNYFKLKLKSKCLVKEIILISQENILL